MRRISVGRAASGIAAISTGSAAGHLVTLVATPVLTRLYPPAAYGAFASLVALVAIASTAGSLRLESAVPIASDGDARTMVRTSALSSLLAGVVCAGLVTLAGHHAVSREPWLGSFLVVYLVWVTAMYGVLTSFSLRGRQYNAVARRNLFQALGTAGGQLGFSALTRSALGLTAGLALGRSLGVASLVRESRVLSASSREAAPGWSTTMRRYWRFPVIFMPSAMFNVLGTQLPILLVTRAYGTESAGNLALAMTFGAIPAALLGAAITSVVRAEMAARIRDGELNQRTRYLRATKGLLPLALAWFLILLLAAPTLLPLMLGPEWEASGAFAAATAIGVATGLVASPLSAVFLLYEKAAINLVSDVSRVVLLLGVGGLAWRFGEGPVVMVLAMSSAMAVIYLVTWVLGLRIVSSGADPVPGEP